MPSHVTWASLSETRSRVSERRGHVTPETILIATAATLVAY
jgi:hypothetical protein